MTVRSLLRSLTPAALGAALWFTPAAHAVIVADSVADFPASDNVTANSKQGINNWIYGYHQDGVAGAGFSYNAGSFIPFPDNDGPGVNANDFWTGSSWDWANAGGLVNPPWTTINATGGHPNSQATGGEQWAIRRYVSEVSGAANVEFSLRKTDINGGDGSTVRVFVNGAALPQSSFAVASNNNVGKTWSIHVPNLQVGDTIDLALDAAGLAAGSNSDSNDTSAFSMKVDHIATAPSKLLADSIADFPTGNDSSPKQGTNNWFYGRHNVTANGGNGYQTSDFIAFPDNQAPGTSATDWWTGTMWDVHQGNPPWTEISATGGHPNGTNNAGAQGHGESWIIRRYVAEEGGDLVVDSFFAKTNTASSSNGILGRIFLNGIEVYNQLVPGTDGVGFNAATVLYGVQPGDFIDIVVDANGADGSDGSAFNAQIFRLQFIPEPTTAALGMIGMLTLGLRRRRQA